MMSSDEYAKFWQSEYKEFVKMYDRMTDAWNKDREYFEWVLLKKLGLTPKEASDMLTEYHNPPVNPAQGE